MSDSSKKTVWYREIFQCLNDFKKFGILRGERVFPSQLLHNLFIAQLTCVSRPNEMARTVWNEDLKTWNQ